MPRHDNAGFRLVLLEYLTTYIAEHGYAPSNVEIQTALGRTKPTITSHLVALHEEGVITYGGESRAIAIND